MTEGCTHTHPPFTNHTAANLPETDTDFVALGAANSSWNVVRSEFDQILLEHAGACGAGVFTETRADVLHFAPRPPPPTPAASGSRSRSNSGERGVEFGEMGRPVGATYTTAGGVKGEISFDYLVDASGRNGLLSTRCVSTRCFGDTLAHAGVSPPGTSRTAGTTSR